MGSRDRNVLSRQDAIEVLLFVFENGPVKKTDLQKVATMHTIDTLLPLLEAEHLLIVKEDFIGRRTYIITLTAKGVQVALRLKSAMLITKKDSSSEDDIIKMHPDWQDRFKGLSTMTHLNVLDDHVAIQEIDISGKITGVVMVYVKRINSHFELWCEKDESKECKHVDFAWSLPQMRSLIEEYIRSGKKKDRTGQE